MLCWLDLQQPFWDVDTNNPVIDWRKLRLTGKEISLESHIQEVIFRFRLQIPDCKSDCKQPERWLFLYCYLTRVCMVIIFLNGHEPTDLD